MPSNETDVLEELAGLPTIAHPTVSPDGDSVALYYDDTGRNELHVLDIESGERTQWSDGNVPRNARWYVEWGPDGDEIFFHQDEGGDEQNDIHAIDADGQTRVVVESDGQNTIEGLSEDGSTLVFTSSRDGQMNVYSHDFDTGETTKLTEYERAVWTVVLSPDDSRMAYCTNESDDFDNMDVYVADADGSNARNLDIGETGAEAMPADFAPDGERLLVMDNTPDNSRCGIYDLDSDEVTWYGDADSEEHPEAFLDDGERFVATRTRDAATVPIVYDVDSGESRELDVPEGVASFGQAGDAVVDDHRVIFTHTTPTHRSELLLYDLDTDETRTLVDAEYGPFSPEDFADAEYFTVESDGVPETPAKAIDHDPYETMDIGALLYDPGEHPAPLIVNPHGGPRGQDQKSFDLYTQFLCQQGYAVLKINYRGSTGRGRAFIESLYDDWGGAEQGDMAIAAEHVLGTRDWLDDERVAVFGGSYGGYSAYWQLVQYPDLYDAGVAWIGLTDLEDMFENTMPHYRTELMEKYMGTPGDNPDLYEQRSPVTHAENLDAPLFVVHGVNDRRVPVSQARIFRERLEDLGYDAGEDFEYEELGEEGHASSDQEQKLRMFRLLTDFLDRRV